MGLVLAHSTGPGHDLPIALSTPMPAVRAAVLTLGSVWQVDEAPLAPGVVASVQVVAIVAISGLILPAVG
ncbi:MAG TPA: hypothetical protein VFR23_12015 [Jiangellaceae bacterium]|nr:hypothetical protein [Jiangellaceae bacterium]